MELKGFDDKKSPVVTIIGAVVAVLVGLWVLKRILGTLFLLAKIAIFLVIVLAIAGSIIRWNNKRNRDKR